METSVKYHLIGIGGSGMSAIARVLQCQGHKVTGSDRSESQSTRKLQDQGICVKIGHDAANIIDSDIVVYSAAIPDDNPELAAAREQGIETVERSEMLGRLMREYPIRIAVSGTHGKTSTTAMIDQILHRAGLNPTSLIGSDIAELNGNARCGGKEIFVTEACEAFGSFLHLDPTIAVITNIDADHLDYYGDLEHVEEAFKQFAERVDPNGIVIVCSDNPRTQAAVAGSGRRMLTYGVQGRPDYLANFVSVTEVHPSYNLLRVGLEMGSIRLKVPGEHNVLNSLAAAAVAAHLGVDMSSIQSALLDFKGAERRFEVVYDNDGIMVIDDYAHHPAEIKATLSGAKSGYQKRVLAIFQPHLYSRTELMLDEFALALTLADEVIVIPAYAAREKPEDGVDGDSIVAKMLEGGYKAVEYVANQSELAGIVRKRLKEGTMALFMGAGDIGLISRELAADLSGGACC